MDISNGRATAAGAAVETGPPMTPDQVRAVRVQDAEEAERRVEKLEAKAESIKEALKEARDDAKRLRRFAEEVGE